MDTGEDDAATTTISATSNRPYASVVVTQASSSAALPISIAALKRENSKYKAQLAKQPGVPTAVTSIVVS
jgi:hypothetical protein